MVLVEVVVGIGVFIMWIMCVDYVFRCGVGGVVVWCGVGGV